MHADYACRIHSYGDEQDRPANNIAGSSLDSWASYCNRYEYKTDGGDEVPSAGIDFKSAYAPEPQESLVEEVQEPGASCLLIHLH